jgi:hypothetical protein
MSSKSKALAAVAPLTLISGLGAAGARRPVAALAACRGGPRSPRAFEYVSARARDWGHQPAQTGPDEPVEPPGIPPGQSPQSYAIQAIDTLLSESPLAHKQIREARHGQAEAHRLAAEAARTGHRSADAQERAAAERRKASPHERINRPHERINRPLGIGIGLTVALALLDALPAYWSAQAFRLSQTSTLILTVLLCAALSGAMWLLNWFTRQGRRSALRILGGTLAAGFLAMFVLRLQYLQVTGVAGFWPEAIEALALTAVSAALVAAGLLSARAGRRADPQDTVTAGRRANLSVLAVGCADPGASRTVSRPAPSRTGHRIVQPGWTG